MKIVLFAAQSGSESSAPRVGSIHGDRVVDLRRAQQKLVTEKSGAAQPNTETFSTLASFIEAGRQGLDDAAAAQEYVLAAGAIDRQAVLSLSEVDLLAPLPSPASRIPCAGGNFAAHLAGIQASMKGEAPSLDSILQEARSKEPWGFWKVAREVAGPEQDIVFPSRRGKLFDYEGEVGAVLSRRCKEESVSSAANAIWGFVLVNDWSIRDSTEASRKITFGLSKNFDGCASIGPIISVGELDPSDVQITTRVNGQTRQDFNSRDMIYSYAEFIEYLTRDLTLYPGDILSGGTGPGTAMDSTRRGPDGPASMDLYLKPGDVVEVSSPELGTLRNRVIASS